MRRRHKSSYTRQLSNSLWSRMYCGKKMWTHGNPGFWYDCTARKDLKTIGGVHKINQGSSGLPSCALCRRVHQLLTSIFHIRLFALKYT